MNTSCCRLAARRFRNAQVKGSVCLLIAAPATRVGRQKRLSTTWPQELGRYGEGLSTKRRRNAGKLFDTTQPSGRAYLWPNHVQAYPTRLFLQQPRGLHTTRRRDVRRDDEDSKPIEGSSRQSPLAPQPLSTPLTRTREKTKELTQRVRSNLTSITPHENIYNVPNVLTASRLIASPVIGYLIVQGDLKWALGLFFYAGVTDLIDGWLARRYNLRTVVGSVIDPMADKLLMTIVTVTLAVKGLIPAYLATLILGRDVTLAVAAIYYRFASLPAPKTLVRYWDFSLPSAQVHPTTVSKYNTFLQLILIGASLTIPVITAESQNASAPNTLGANQQLLENGLTYLQYLVAATTAWSGISYAFLKDAVTIIGKDEKLKQRQGRRGRAIIGVSFGTVTLVSVWLAFFRATEQNESEIDRDDE